MCRTVTHKHAAFSSASSHCVSSHVSGHFSYVTLCALHAVHSPLPLQAAGMGVSDTALLRIDFLNEADALLAEAQSDMAAAAETILSQNPALAEHLVQELELPGKYAHLAGASEGDSGQGLFSRGSGGLDSDAPSNAAGSSDIDADLVAIQLRFAERLRVLDRVQEIRDMAATLRL